MSTLDIAIEITVSAFQGKVDKGGQPYILHCLHVMNQMPQDDHELMCIAVMHDLIEDTPYSIGDLRGLGFSDRVLYAVNVLSHIEGESYDLYIKGVSSSRDAILVKRADLRHNSDIMRMKGLRKKDFDRLEKYHRAYEYLKGL